MRLHLQESDKASPLMRAILWLNLPFSQSGGVLNRNDSMLFVKDAIRRDKAKSFIVADNPFEDRRLYEKVFINEAIGRVRASFDSDGVTS